MMFFQKILALGLGVVLAPELVEGMSNLDEFSLGDPLYVCLRDDGVIASGAQGTCNQGSFAAKLYGASEGSNGRQDLHFADSQDHEYTLHINCPQPDPTTTIKTVTLPITTDTVTITPPPVTETEISTQAYSSGSDQGNGLCTTGRGFCVDEQHDFTVAADCPHHAGWESKGCQCLNAYSYATRTPDCNAGYTYKCNGC
ncbi:hypothetical protein ASPVEDRAFT_82358 [Aspergillus versicolor CBS 583.65]|uniref:EGF-like domain-containing protein n=1 Tax=Aspergillus versicolor CBS 583.65 TaxID=1036611 RepID=A0A1L9PH57_ASPVE|nr:uncharacterized protein ASPVEDRAFT_82358 [Aspergillus versicolor CBS 583.65]OJJ00803.1 hypothetical protein ASPVEDRAFT_82358 [Aspergillus versicolor CBS 583.65]